MVRLTEAGALHPVVRHLLELGDDWAGMGLLGLDLRVPFIHLLPDCGAHQVPHLAAELRGP